MKAEKKRGLIRGVPCSFGQKHVLLVPSLLVQILKTWQRQLIDSCPSVGRQLSN